VVVLVVGHWQGAGSLLPGVLTSSARGSQTHEKFHGYLTSNTDIGVHLAASHHDTQACPELSQYPERIESCISGDQQHQLLTCFFSLDMKVYTRLQAMGIVWRSWLNNKLIASASLTASPSASHNLLAPIIRVERYPIQWILPVRAVEQIFVDFAIISAQCAV
jgi:hypothetical protein